MRDRPRRTKWLTCFVPHRLEMLVSPSWQKAPIPVRRLLERLEVEYLRHGAHNNGELYVPFTQFVAAGVSRRTIRPALDLAVALGLVEVIATDGAGDIRGPNAYRLTYIPTKNALPTDEWKMLGSDRAGGLVAKFRHTNGERS